MTNEEKYWMDVCRRRKDDFVIVVDNDEAFVQSLHSGECEFVFEHYGYRLALDLFLHIGCNAEDA